MITLYQFAKDSNEIEMIYDEQRNNAHKVALERFLALQKITIPDLEDFVRFIEPEHALRRTKEDRVFIGGHEAPRAPKSLALLEKLLENINAGLILPWAAHAEYEFIHPFTDGNGRSGRALWLWVMQRKYKGDIPPLYYPFLQWYYYQTLSNYSENRDEK